MPGRPQRMAEKATQMEAMTYVTAGEIFLAAPRKYLPTNEPDDRPSDPVSQRWKLCIELSMMLHAQALHLANLLRAKADLPPIVDIDAPPEPPSNGKLEPAA